MKCPPRPKAHWKKWVTNKWVHIFGTDMLKTLNERSKQYWQIRKRKWVPGSDSLNNKFLVSHHDCLPLRLKHHFQEISKEPPYSLALNIICLIISSTVSLAAMMQPPQPHKPTADEVTKQIPDLSLLFVRYNFQPSLSPCSHRQISKGESFQNTVLRR